jgi:hypothetical protein
VQAGLCDQRTNSYELKQCSLKFFKLKKRCSRLFAVPVFHLQRGTDADVSQPEELAQLTT